MNINEINWDAVAAIGTCLGALASFLTVLFAVLSNRSSNKLINKQISSMTKQLDYLSKQNHIANSSLEEAKKQTDIARDELKAFSRQAYLNQLNPTAIRLANSKPFLDKLDVQNQLLAKICRESEEENLKTDENSNAD